MQVILTILFSVSFNSYGQTNYCDTCYSDRLVILGSAEAKGYRENFDRTFRKTDRLRLMYSLSVEFSGTQLKEFFSRNPRSRYCGFNIYFVNTPKENRPGHGSQKQIGLVLVPRERSGEPDFDGYLVENIAFDRTRGHEGRGWRPRVMVKSDFLDAKAEYAVNFPNLIDSIHTKYVLVGEKTSDFLEAFVSDVSNSKYETYRFSFMNYGKMESTICGLSSQKQIGVFITPVNEVEEDFDAFLNYFVKYKTKRNNANWNSLNHGSLCPNYCPDGDY